jgi:hypothetical protein
MKNFLSILARLVIPLAISQASFALVDYSETVSQNEEKKGMSSKAGKPTSMASMSSSGARSMTWKADYSLTTNYESMEIKGEKYGVMNVGFHLQTPFDVFIDSSYWNASGNNGSSSGNPKVILGFNWLKFGNPSEEARLNLFGGMKFASSSVLASSRNDKIVGAETTKRFGSMGLGVGYDLTMVGASKRETEKSIGNISRIVVSAGWMVSNDIQFELDIENFSIAADTKSVKANRLDQKVSFSTLSPKLHLGLATAINLELGARFRIKKASEEANLLSANVFDLHGANANSLFAGLNLSI